jgi:hypothetical protein
LSSTALLNSLKRLLSPPYTRDWSWRSHSPPWSQIGQSNGWLISKNSRTPSLAFFTEGLLVFIDIFGETGTAQDALVPIPLFACAKCGHVNNEFLPLEMREDSYEEIEEVIPTNKIEIFQ